jgi:hypothetical protein
MIPARGRAALLWTVVALVVGVTSTGCGSATGTSPVRADTTVTLPFKISDRVDSYGISIGTQTSFDDDVVLSAPTASVAGATGPVQLWPLDDQEHEGEVLDPLTVPAGTSVLMEAWVRPSCPGDRGSEPAIQVHVEHSDGRTELARFVASDPSLVLPALDRWCSLGVKIHVSHAAIWPDGRIKAYLSVTNPGPGTIHVEIPAYADEHATWQAAAPTEVPAGNEVTIEIDGTDVACEPGETASWQENRLLVDGEPFLVRGGESYCGS